MLDTCVFIWAPKLALYTTDASSDQWIVDLKCIFQRPELVSESGEMGVYTLRRDVGSVQSKLAMQMLTAELASRLGTRSPTVNCLDPGTPESPILYTSLRCKLSL